MKTKLIMLLILLPTVILWTGCQDETQNPDVPERANTLNVSYRIDGAEEVITYATTAEPHECKINNLYTFFFRETGHTDAGEFVGYQRTGTTATTGAAGTARITMPGTENVDDAWQLLFIANLEEFLDLEGEADTDSWIAAKIPPGTLLTDVQHKLKGIADRTSGLKAPLLMGAEMIGAEQKPANQNKVTVNLKRLVSRIDITNSDPNFTLESVWLYNARSRTYIMVDQGNMTETGATAYTNYSMNEVAASSGMIMAKLYAFANISTVPAMKDKQTTCLIIKGTLSTAGGGSGTPTYYRVNVCPPGASQNIKKNGAYTINLSKVKSDGKNDREEAYNDQDLCIDYLINEWDDAFNGMYLFDKDGNGLAVSQRNLIFSDAAGQDLAIEVFTIKSATNPITGIWTLEPMTGTDASAFKQEKLTLPEEEKYIRFTTKNQNKGAQPFTATATVKWGTIELPVSLRQLDPNSQLSGIRAIPNSVWFPKTPTVEVPVLEKEIKIDMQGNFGLLTDPENQIKVSILYLNGQNSENWLKYEYKSWDPAGIATYTVKTDNLTDPDISYRDADVKFTVIDNPTIMTCKAYVRQSHIDSETENQVHQVYISCYRLKTDRSGYDNLNAPQEAYNKFKGFPTTKAGNRDLQFSLNDKEYLKYKLDITTTRTWKLDVDNRAHQNLEFVDDNDLPKMSGGGHTLMETVWIKAKSSDLTAGWSGANIDIVYEDGTRSTYQAHQEGVMATLPQYYAWNNTATLVNDGNTYYYGVINIAGRLWLDRNIGASTDEHYDNATDCNVDVGGDNIGRKLSRAQANVACPQGYRLPKIAGNGSEWDAWLQRGAYSATKDEKGLSGWYIQLDSEADKRQYIPINSYTIDQGSNTIFAAAVGYIAFGATWKSWTGNMYALRLSPGGITTYRSSFDSKGFQDAVMVWWPSNTGDRSHYVMTVNSDVSWNTTANIAIGANTPGTRNPGIGYQRFFVRCIKKLPDE